MNIYLLLYIFIIHKYILYIYIAFIKQFRKYKKVGHTGRLLFQVLSSQSIDIIENTGRVKCDLFDPYSRLVC
jgi:hypothetical protein